MKFGLCLAVIGTVVATVKCTYDTNDRVRPERPHIIFFLVDDMGWNDVGYHNMTQIPTPNIDSLASNSIILNNYYTHPACSPSRAALLSGKYATTIGLQHLVMQDPQKIGLPLDLKTLADVLKSQGYTTHMLGKWHLGFYEKKYTPNRRGFDNFYGFWEGETDLFYHVTAQMRKRSELYGVPCYETRDSIPFGGITSRHNFRPVDNGGQYLTYVYTKQSKEIIRNHDPKKPLFLYYAHHGVHKGNPDLPVRAPKSLTDRFSNIEDSDRRNFAGALTAIDLSLGELMDAMDRKRMLDNTIIILSSDNGSPLPAASSNGGSNYPFRGGKLTGWEGGVRANSFIWYNQFKYSGLYDGMMHIVDWMPTLYKAAGGKRDIAALYGLDGKDMWGAIQENKPSPRTNMVLQNDSMYDYKVYRSGDYKLIMGTIPDQGANSYYGDNGREPPPADYPKSWSNTERVLRNFYRRLKKQYVRNGPVIQVKCLDESQNIDCVVSEDMICLYNIAADPCEQRNLAQLEPDTVARLQEEFKQLNGKAPIYPFGDYGSNPIYYGGYWSSWGDLNYDYNSTSC